MLVVVLNLFISMLIYSKLIISSRIRQFEAWRWFLRKCMISSGCLKSRLWIKIEALLAPAKMYIERLVCFNFMCLSQQFFSHVGTDLPGLNQ